MYFYIAVLFLCFSLPCNSQNKDSIPFKIEGRVIGLNNKKLTLLIPSYSLDHRQTTVVKNDSFSFEGKLVDSFIYAKILLDEDITNPTGGYTNFPLIISYGHNKISFKASPTKNEVIRYRFSELLVHEGNASIEYKKYQSFLNKEVFNGLSYRSDSSYLDSINRFVMPKRIELFEKLFLQIKDSITISYVKLKLLEDFSKSGLYDRENKYLTDAEKSFLLTQYSSLKSQVNKHTENPYWDAYFTNFAIKQKSKFRDFELVDLNQKKIKLSTIIKKNKYTVLYFWWSGCVPCRKFINSERSNYAKLKSKNIEFISINTDDIKYKWRKASARDKIPWINLYAGINSPILPAFQVEVYPTKIVFDNQFNIQEVSFQTFQDIILFANDK